MAFVVYRFSIYLGMAFGLLMATLAGAGTLVGFGSLSKNAGSLGPFGAIKGFILFIFFIYRLRKFLLASVLAPQIVLLTEQIKGHVLPTGKAQIEFAHDKLNSFFPNPSELHELDDLIKACLIEISRRTPIPAPFSESSHLHRIYRSLQSGIFSLNHLPILASVFNDQTDRTWTNSAKALAVFEKSHHSIITDRLTASIFEWLFLALTYPVLLIGIRRLISEIPMDVSFWPYVFALVFCWVIKSSFLDGIVESAIAQRFISLTDEAPYNLDDSEIRSASPSYNSILEGATLRERAYRL